MPPRVEAGPRLPGSKWAQARRFYENVSAEAIASLISEFWLGMEFARLIGGAEEQARHTQALDAIEQMLVALEATSPKTRLTPRIRRSRAR